MRPFVSGPLTFGPFNESDASSTVSLLGNATDVDTGDTLSVTNVTTSGDAAGVTVSGNNLIIDPSANASLNQGQSASFTVTYQVRDLVGGLSEQTTATVTINGEGTQTGNTAPTVTAINQSFSVTDAATSINLADFANDVDNDPLTFTLVGTPTGDALGTSFNVNGTSTISVDPSQNTGLTAGQSRTITYTYNVSDGTNAAVQNTAVITITGVDPTNNAPTVSGAITRSLSEDDAVATVNLLDGATDADGDTLSVTGLTITGNQAGINVNGSTLTVTPSAYGAALNDGDTATVVLTYSISDGNGGTVGQTATINILGADEPVGNQTIRGELYIDHIENLAAVISSGADPIRNGQKDTDEPGLAGVVVTLTLASGGQQTTVTDIEGVYEFNNLPAGQHTVSYTLPESVVHTGPTSQTVTPGQNSGAGLGVLDVQGPLGTLDILVSSYLASNQEMSAASDGGLVGGKVALDASGAQELFLPGGDMTGIKFAELALNAEQDAALLSVLKSDNTVETVRLNSDQFVVSNDGRAVQFFGSISDLLATGSSPQDLISEEFPTFLDAIDQAIAQGV